MKIYYKQDKSNHQYYLSNAMLKCVDSYKHLGVIMSRDLSWSNHLDASVNKASKVLGLLRRTIGSKNRETFSVLYRSLVRPPLEYASPVWSPYLVKDKLAIESIPRRASRIVLWYKRREISYEERCELPGLSTRERRREYFSLVACYKVVFTPLGTRALVPGYRHKMVLCSDFVPDMLICSHSTNRVRGKVQGTNKKRVHTENQSPVQCTSTRSRLVLGQGHRDRILAWVLEKKACSH